MRKRLWVQFQLRFFIQDAASLAEASMLLASVAFVRHPFSRLASGYLEKFVFAQQVD